MPRPSYSATADIICQMTDDVSKLHVLSRSSIKLSQHECKSFIKHRNFITKPKLSNLVTQILDNSTASRSFIPSSVAFFSRLFIAPHIIHSLVQLRHRAVRSQRSAGDLFFFLFSAGWSMDDRYSPETTVVAMSHR